WGLLCSFQHAFICGQSGATITCQGTGCDRSFHLPCAAEGECVAQYLAPFRYLLSPTREGPGTSHFTHPLPLPPRAFCWEHRPQQAVEAAPEENTVCLICLDPVGDGKSYSILVCSVCKHTWFHRVCIRLLLFLLQGHAINNGFTCFQCPNCRDKDRFCPEMCTTGI
ncbi:G2E3 ligase, partial [Hemiprocne comata]|nr:G2E3 ligase [Hemiprocne comata]